MNRRTKLASALLACALVFSLTAWSQEARPSHAATLTQQSPERYFRLDFRVLDVSPQGNITSSRSYHEMIAEGTRNDRTSSIRVGARILVPVGGFQTSKNGAAAATQFRYMDVNTDIDVSHVEFVDQALRLSVRVNISTPILASSYMPANYTDMKEPITRQATWNSDVTVPIRKPTIIFSADNNTDKGKIELELTAVPVNQ